MDSRELTEWRAWEAVHGPLGAERHDWLAASVSRTLVMVNQSRGRPPRIADFLPFELGDGGGGGSITNAEQMMEWVQGMVARKKQLEAS